MAVTSDKLLLDNEYSSLANDGLVNSNISSTEIDIKSKMNTSEEASLLESLDTVKCGLLNTSNVCLKNDSIYNNNLELLNFNNGVCGDCDAVQSEISENTNESSAAAESKGSGDISNNFLCSDVDESKHNREGMEFNGNTKLKAETNSNLPTEFYGVELLYESNVKESFLDELSTTSSTENVESKFENLIKDDSTDIDNSFSDLVSSESDKDASSSTVESYYHHLHEIQTKHKNEIDSLKQQLTVLESEARHEECQSKITAMEQTMQQLQIELDLSKRERNLDSRTFAKEKMELESKVENLKKDYQAANKDREAAVVRYACGEMELMNQKKERESAEKKLKDITKEKEVLINKLKTLTNEKTRVCQMLDNKCSELTAAQKEIDSLKEEVNSRDIKLKWVQNKLRTETDSKKEVETKLEALNSKIQESLQESDKAKHEAQESIKQFQESEENKAYVLGQQLKEERVKSMLVEHERDECESARKQLLNELEICRVNLKASTEENNTLAVKVQILEKERLEYEKNLSQLKHKTDTQSHDITELQHSLKDMEALRIQLQCEQERVSNSQLEMERLRQSNLELLQDMESCRKRESDMLEFTQKLTAKNVRLQSEFTAVEAKVQQLECDEAPLQKKITELDGKIASLLKSLEKEKAQRIEESKVLARHLAEKTARVKTLESQVEDLTNEIQLVKRKDGATIKELNRELAQLRRRFENNESGSGSDSLCHGSRASSCTSLNDHSTAVPPQPPSSNNHSVRQIEPNRQALIERIGKLQRENAKAVEKVEFLEEHSRTLVEELQKKSKVLQSYMLREDAGALSSSSMDLNKAELAKHGGIMASVYGSKAVDDNMTLELSLEINRKLQAVLEDTLLKNITLKENIDTLGDEIARLSQRIPQL